MNRTQTTQQAAIKAFECGDSFVMLPEMLRVIIVKAELSILHHTFSLFHFAFCSPSEISDIKFSLTGADIEHKIEKGSIRRYCEK